MKKTLTIIGLLLAAGLFTAQAQTNQLPSIYNQVTTWLTTPDTNNLTLEKTLWRVQTGPATQSGVTISDDFLVQRNFKTNGGWGVLSLTRNAGIAGTVLCEEAGVGFSLNRYDLEATPFLIAGYRFDTSHIVGSAGAEVRHMLSANSFAGIGAQLDFARKTTPLIRIELGYAF